MGGASDADAKRDAVLRRMLATPKPGKKPKDDGGAKPGAYKRPKGDQKSTKTGA